MKTLITIYQSTAFGVAKYEGTLVAIGAKKYAQYDNAPFIHFVPKGKRKPTGLIATSHPYLVVLEGHGHVSPADPFTTPSESSTGLMVSSSRYSSFDERYKTDFDPILNEVVKNSASSVLMDVRHTVNTNFLKTV